MKVWMRTLLLMLILAVPTILIGALSRGPGAGVVLVTGILMLVAGGIIVALTARQGRRAEQVNDERAGLVLARAMKFSFLLTALAIQIVWALEFAGYETGTRGVSAIHYVFWFSFMAAWGYHNLRA